MTLLAYHSEIAESHAWLIEEIKTGVSGVEVDFQNFLLTSEDKVRGLAKLVQEAAPLVYGE